MILPMLKWVLIYFIAGTILALVIAGLLLVGRQSALEDHDRFHYHEDQSDYGDH